MDDYQYASFLSLSDAYQLRKYKYGYGLIMNFPPDPSVNGWISEMQPSRGLFVSSAWFTPENNLVHTINTKKPCMWILCIDCGSIICSRQGKASTTLSFGIHVIINPEKPFKMTFPKGIHACFTSVLVFDDFILPFTNSRPDAPLVCVEQARLWKKEHYDTPYNMLLLEQIRWAVRNADMPLLAYEGMVIHLLSSIARNYPKIPSRRSSRRCYVTWEDEQKLHLVKKRLDEDILNPPKTEELCRLSDMSESKLRLAFKNIYKLPLNQYIRTEVMKQAMQLLSADHLSIRNISEICGYKNAAKFTAAFKEVHGITPSQFRKAFNL